MKYNIGSFVFGKLGKDSASTSGPGGDDDGSAAAAGGPVSPKSLAGRGNSGTMTSTNLSVAETASAEVPAEFVCSERFSNSFWSNDERCISVLMHKLKSAKQTCADILNMVSMRAAMEDELGKKMSKLARSGLGTEEVGATKDALRAMRHELDANAKAHIELAKQLRAEIEKPLATFISDQRLKRRAQTSIIQKTEGDRNALRSQARKLQDKRRGDTKKVGDLELQVNGLQGTGDPKLRAKLERAQAQQKSTESEYVDIRARLKDADRQWFNVWRSACDVFQVLEEERIEYLKTTLWTYTNLVSSCCVADDESMERIRQDLEKISVADDISTFIQTFGTGEPDPALARAAGATTAAADDGSESVPPDQQRQQQHQQHQQQNRRSQGSDSEDAHRDASRAHRAQSRMVAGAGQSGASAIPAPSPYAVPGGGSANNTVNSMSTSSGTARSGSILAHQTSRPQTQESIRHGQRPASMHSAGPISMHPGGPGPMHSTGPVLMHPATGPVQMHPNGPLHVHGQYQQQQQPPMVSASPSWNGRPGSSMQGPASFDGTYRRASNNDMYAMANGQPQQFVQRTNSQAGMYGGDPRAQSSMGGYRGSGTASPMLIPAQQPQQRPGTPSQMSDMSGSYGGVVQGMQHPPPAAAPPPPQLMGSPRMRSGTYNGPAHTGNFGTLTGNAQMHPSPQQPFAGSGGGSGGGSPHHPQGHGSAPNSPYIQPIGANGGRPGSAAGMHTRSPSTMQNHPIAGSRPVSAMQPSPYGMGAAPVVSNVYRSATPVQQQPQQNSPQYATGMGNRPPTQMSHSPAPQPHHHQQQMAAAPSPQMHARAPSVMGGYGVPPPAQQQQQQRPMSRVDAANSNNKSVSESGKEILFYVKVLYDYDADNDRELTIHEGDVISVLAVSADGWWEGEMTDRRTGRPLHGTFPSNFTDPIANFIS